MNKVIFAVLLLVGFIFEVVTLLTSNYLVFLLVGSIWVLVLSIYASLAWDWRIIFVLAGAILLGVFLLGWLLGGVRMDRDKARYLFGIGNKVRPYGRRDL